MEAKRENWGSRFGFIMTAAGFSIGLGNIWRFPYLTGQNGGGAFVFVYLLICLCIGIPLFNMEMSLGRKARKNAVEGMRNLTHKGSIWVGIGWIGILAAFFILTYYMQIMGWVFNYVLKAATGTITSTKTAEGFELLFTNLMANPLELTIYTLICLVIVAVISSQGLEKGIEKACKFMMPALFVMLIILAIRSLTLPNAIEGVKYYLTIDFTKINANVFLLAIGQAFFSIGISSGGAFIYGSYLANDSDIPTDTTLVAFLDTLIALIAGLVIFPAIFALGLKPDSGANLLFITMSNLFSSMPMGRLFAFMFFLLTFFAALSSAIGYLEPCVITLVELGKMSRKKAVLISSSLVFIVGFPAILAQGPWKEKLILGRNYFDFMDFLSGNIMMPVGAILISIYVAYVWKFKNFQAETNIGAKKLKIYDWWMPFVTFIIPIVMVIIFVTGII